MVDLWWTWQFFGSSQAYDYNVIISNENFNIIYVHYLMSLIYLIGYKVNKYMFLLGMHSNVLYFKYN